MNPLSSVARLNVLMRNSDSTYRAEDAVDELSGMIRQVLDSHQILAQRLLTIEIGLYTTQPLSSHLPQTKEEVPETIQRTVQGFAFEEDLSNSWVYKRSERSDNGGAFSVLSAAGRTASWSMLSGLSLSYNISMIAIQGLPVYAQDISNSEVYKFGEYEDSDVDFKGKEDKNSYNVGDLKSSRSFRKRLSELAVGIKISRKPLDSSIKPASSASYSLAASSAVFGVPLHQSIRYANSAISLVDAEGRLYIYGYVPIIVAKIGVFIKEKGKICHILLFQQVACYLPDSPN